MNRLLIALCLFVLAGGFVAFHTHEVLALSQDLEEICSRVEDAYRRDDWESVRDNTQQLQERWDKSRFWASLTIETNQIEEIEISLKQSAAYAELQAKPDFIGEFIMFQTLSQHLPHQEGFDIKELL